MYVTERGSDMPGALGHSAYCFVLFFSLPGIQYTIQASVSQLKK